MSIKEKIISVPEEKISRNSNIWNAIFSMLNAVQSVVLLFFVSNFCGEDEAGIFSYAFSVAYLMIMIANYGVRIFQATDINDGEGFGSYLVHRIITCLAAIAIIFVYATARGYTGLKYNLVVLCTVLKVIESIEDVFHGEYQREGRLDAACFIGVIRYIISMVIFVITYILFKDLSLAFVALCLISFILFLATNIYMCSVLKIRRTDKKEGGVIRLFRVCFPLFITTFFNIYICNAAKYSLEKYSSDAVQGYYGMLFMPVFVINLLCIFIYRPKLVELAEYWRDGETDKLETFILRQIMLIIIITLIVIAGGYILGIHVLSVFFGTDLSPYKIPFVILLAGGGMTAAVEFMNNIFTVVRKQNIMVWIYCFIFLAAFLFTGVFVKGGEIFGASLAYTIMVTVQAVVMSIYIISYVRKKK